jgi:hypothetical protein
MEGCWWNVEVGISTTEVIMPSIGLVDRGSPSQMILCYKEWMLWIDPCLFEAFNAFHIILLTHCQHQMIVFNLATVSQLNLILLGEEFIYTNAFGMGVEHVY